MGIAENIEKLKHELPADIKLVAVSKTMPVDKIMEAYRAGQRIFGENKVQEMVDKQRLLPADIQWHLIGHLQTNKVKYIIPFVQLIHSVDSAKLLGVINAEAKKHGRVVDCLLQVKIAREESKFGLKMEEALQLINSEEYKGYNYIRITGLMGMASFTDDSFQIREEFNYLANCFNDLKNKQFVNKSTFKELSMGMSGDYKTAIESGATMVRIGSLVFGDRVYNKI